MKAYAGEGDKITLNFAGKTYQKKIKKNASTLTFTQKIKKQKKGTKIKVTLFNKYKQVRAKKTVKVSN